MHAELQIACADKGMPDQADFDRWLQACFPHEPPQSVLIRIVDMAESAALNQQYRNITGPTNILSFPFEVPPGLSSDLPGNDHLGDLVMCAPLLEREALAQNKPGSHHWAHLLVHGVLHLQGFDHLTPEDALKMESLETRLLARLEIPDPYNDTG